MGQGDREFRPCFWLVLAEGSVQVIRRHGVDSCESDSRESLRESITASKRGGPRTAPLRSHRIVERQFGTGALGFGGKAELTLIPRSKSSAMINALSFFGSGGM